MPRPDAHQMLPESEAFTSKEPYTYEAAESPAEHLRQGWDEAFKAMAVQGDDTLLDEEAQQLSSWDETEWMW